MGKRARHHQSVAPRKDLIEIESVLERVKHLASEAETKLDNAIEFIDASEARIAKMEAEHAARMAVAPPLLS